MINVTKIRGQMRHPHLSSGVNVGGDDEWMIETRSSHCNHYQFSQEIDHFIKSHRERNMFTSIYAKIDMAKLANVKNLHRHYGVNNTSYLP